MYLTLFIFFASLAGSFPLDSIVRETFPSSNPRCILIEEIPQQLLPGVRFLVVDTSCITVAPRSADFPTARMAVDSLGGVYRLFADAEAEFNRLVLSQEVTVTLATADSIARLFLETAILYDPFGYHYAANADSFVKLQVRLGKEGITGNGTLNRGELQKQLEMLPDTIGNGWLEYRAKLHRWFIDYYIWFETDGRLMKYSVSISDQGECTIEEAKTLGEKIGNYRKVRL